MPPTPTAQATDNELARDALRGSTAAFETLYRRHVGRVHGAVLRLVGYDHGRAEELVQEAFVKAWQKLGSFRHESAFGTWLYRLSVNTALMALRSQASSPIYDAGEDGPPDVGEEPFCPAERRELEQAIAALPPRARVVLVLHDVEGWRHEDIARETGMAVGSSKAQLHRARGLLRRALGERS
ncbi:sigma-70 family RNA polymerase sigma factor [Oleiagrimonas sp. C23AA]|uniref:RNA polymerase sigma factor n=1 Tax=Oleiagrimonas sp. C23AA TaxID=2719047 RepID=UPI001422982E|nr:sigma-70 family RNA polymerase sigma factor [Oleiagrimonas sp. C23AA]NII12109.1 sigma-70 family RNA polymerase sigma factor [Oleiagrimonas sp. C23AA]